VSFYLVTFLLAFSSSRIKIGEVQNLINERNRGQSNLPIPNMIIEDRRINTNTLIHELQIKKIIKVIYH